jgi:hypothetical protein
MQGNSPQPEQTQPANAEQPATPAPADASDGAARFLGRHWTHGVNLLEMERLEREHQRREKQRRRRR